MNTFINAMRNATNSGMAYTENGAVTRTSTKSALLDLFALGGSYRTRTEDDCIFLFSKAFNENPTYAMKCLFYLRDITEGQGERRFFRTAMHWLAKTHPNVVRANIENIPYFGRWDDVWYSLCGTPCEKDGLNFVKEQLAMDVQCKTPSLLAKWLPSENTSSATTRAKARQMRNFLGMTARQYRKTLSILRARINVLETLMSANKWDKIEFDKIPSRAGMIYRNAFARHDVERAKKNVGTYADFITDADTKVNAKALYPYECVHKALYMDSHTSPTDRAAVNKYWENLTDYIKNGELDAMAIVDVSGSMMCTGSNTANPIDVAISLGMYCAEKAKGPYHNKFITFSSNPKLVEIEGYDFVDKVKRMVRAEWGMSTNIEAVFSLMLNIALQNHLSQEDLPKSLIIISDMEFDAARGRYRDNEISRITLMEGIKKIWEHHGYTMPKLIFWNACARNDNIPMKDDGYVNYVSGMSPSIFDQIIKNVSAYDLMMNKLNSERYKNVK